MTGWSPCVLGEEHGHIADLMKHVAYHWLVAVALMALAAPAFAAPAVSESDCVTLLT